MEKSKINFGAWLIKGYEGSLPGYKRIVNWWLIFHIVLGIVAAVIIESPIKEVSKAILLPLMGVLIGLTFAWAGNAQGYIQSKEIIEISKHKKGGYIDYIFTYQLSILIVLLCTGLWLLPAIDIRELHLFTRPVHLKYLPVAGKICIKAFLYSMISISFHESWSVIKGVHYFLIGRNMLFEAYERKEKSKNDNKDEQH